MRSETQRKEEGVLSNRGNVILISVLIGLIVPTTSAKTYSGYKLLRVYPDEGQRGEIAEFLSDSKS